MEYGILAKPDGPSAFMTPTYARATQIHEKQSGLLGRSLLRFRCRPPLIGSERMGPRDKADKVDGEICGMTVHAPGGQPRVALQLRRSEGPSHGLLGGLPAP